MSLFKGAWLDRSYRQGELDESLVPLYRSLEEA